MSDNIRCIVKCLESFEDGNVDPPVVKRGEVLDLTEDQFHKLTKSGPTHFELLERKFLLPKGTLDEVVVRMATPEEEEIERLAALEEFDPSSIDPPADEIVDWKPIGWYAAQLAREPKVAEA